MLFERPNIVVDEPKKELDPRRLLPRQGMRSWRQLQAMLEAHSRKQAASGISRERDPGAI